MNADRMNEGIETERLVLRPIALALARRIVAGTPDDTDAWAEGFPREDDADGLRGFATSSPDSGQAPPFGSMAITERASGLVIGTIGCYGPPDEQGRVTIGYGLVEQRRGQGLGTEALMALIGYCRARPEVCVILADTELDNKASQRVLDKAGFGYTHADDELCYYQLIL